MLHSTLISALAALRPDILFDRLYRLPWYGGMFEEWARDIGIEAGHDVLELGCGTGALVRAMTAWGATVVGVDRSPAMIRAARRAHGPAPGPYLRADAGALPFAAARFDRVVAASLVNVVKDPERVLREMRRVLRPGGRLALLFPTAEMTPRRARSCARTRRLHGFSAAALQAWARRAPKGDVQGMERSLAEVGFVAIGHRFHLDRMIAAIAATA